MVTRRRNRPSTVLLVAVMTGMMILGLAAESLAEWIDNSSPGSMSARVRLETGESGLYYVDAQDLADLSGTPVRFVRRAIRKRLLRLSTAGTQVPWIKAAASNGLYFYGVTSESPYSERNVYFLQGGQGLKMSRLSGFVPATGPVSVTPASQRVEVDAMPVTFLSAATPDDFYYWSYISAGHPTYGSAVHGFELDDRALFTGSASIDVELQGASSTPADPEHHAEIFVNGTFVGAAIWDGAVPHSASMSFSGDVLQPGWNEILVTAIKMSGVPYSVFLVDGFDITYERLNTPADGAVAFTAGIESVTIGDFAAADVVVLDVSEPLRARQIVNYTIEDAAGGFVVSFLSRWRNRDYLTASRGAAQSPLAMEMIPASGLVRESTGAEYIVIAPAALRSAADDLAAYRQSYGLSVLVAELEEISNVYGAGFETPESIRAFLQHAYSTWLIQPRFVALAGNGTFDFKDVEGYGENLLPPFMTSTPYGFYAWDGYYADLLDDDYSPEIAVGRIPAMSNAELQAYVDKLASYEGLSFGVEPDDLVLLADDADAGGNYPVTSDELLPLLPQSAAVERIYLSEQYVTQARSNLAQALSDGAAWVNYVGHGAVDRFATERLLTVADVPAMPVNGRLPVVSALTCSAGRFEVPGWRSLAGTLALDPVGGAAAVFSASGQSLNFEAQTLNQSLFEVVYSTQAATVGEAVAEALRDYGEQSNLEFMKRIYNLLGDPAYRIR